MPNHNITDWELYLESATDGTGRFIKVDCAEITNINYNTGQRDFRYLRDARTGNNVPVQIVQRQPQNTATVQLPLDDAEWLQHLHRGKCLTAVQIHDCQATQILHFSNVIVNGETIPQLTSGIGSTGGVPVVTLQIIFEKISKLDLTIKPSLAGDKTVGELAPVGEDDLSSVAYCDCETCATDGCGTIFRAWTTMPYVEYSVDGGISFSLLSFDPVWDGWLIGNMVCVNGRLYLTMTTGFVPNTQQRLLYSDNPACGNWTTITPEYQQYLQPVPEPIDAFLVLTGTEKLLYATAFRVTAGFDFDAYVVRSNDGGWHWEPVYWDQNPFLNDFGKIAAVGNVVVVGGTNGNFMWSTDNGNPNTWVRETITINGSNPDILAMDVALPNRFNKSSAVVAIATDDGIYRAFLPDTLTNIDDCDQLIWEQYVDLCSVSDLVSPVSLEIILDGRGLWWGRGTPDKYYYIFDHGQKCLKIEEITFPIGTTLHRNNALLISCPADRSKATLHGEKL